MTSSSAKVLAMVMAAVMLTSVLGDDDRPGTLLLNMLIKNEAFHLERSLPKWAPLIDYWIIGVDDKNTDGSEEIIDKYLGHIPGQKVRLCVSPCLLFAASCTSSPTRLVCLRICTCCILSAENTRDEHTQVVVAFDGMGPTWTVLVQKGLELFPNATHGILSDADFTPTIKSLDKRQLKMECSKHMYKIRCAASCVLVSIFTLVEGKRPEFSCTTRLSKKGGHRKAKTRSCGKKPTFAGMQLRMWTCSDGHI